MKKIILFLLSLFSFNLFADNTYKELNGMYYSIDSDRLLFKITDKKLISYYEVVTEEHESYRISKVEKINNTYKIFVKLNRNTEFWILTITINDISKRLIADRYNEVVFCIVKDK